MPNPATKPEGILAAIQAVDLNIVIRALYFAEQKWPREEAAHVTLALHHVARLQSALADTMSGTKGEPMGCSDG